jgi:hypothetical protein
MAEIDAIKQSAEVQIPVSVCDTAGERNPISIASTFFARLFATNVLFNSANKQYVTGTFPICSPNDTQPI